MPNLDFYLELFGPREWTWIDAPAEKAGACHEVDDRGGIDFSRQGMTRGIPREHFAKLVKIVSEEVGPMGLTENVDVSNDGTCEVNLFNVDDGGYVGIVLITDSGTFSMRYTKQVAGHLERLETSATRTAAMRETELGSGVLFLRCD